MCYKAKEFTYKPKRVVNTVYRRKDGGKKRGVEEEVNNKAIGGRI